jgi:hypothetical protein
MKYLLAYEDGTEYSETLALKLQMPMNNPEESIQHSEHGESLKSRTVYLTDIWPQTSFTLDDVIRCTSFVQLFALWSEVCNESVMSCSVCL